MVEPERGPESTAADILAQEHERVSAHALHAVLSYCAAADSFTELQRLSARKHVLSRRVRGLLETIDAHRDGAKDLLEVCGFLELSDAKDAVAALNAAIEDRVASRNLDKVHEVLDTLADRRAALQHADLLRAIADETTRGGIGTHADFLQAVEQAGATAAKEAAADSVAKGPEKARFTLQYVGDPEREPKIEPENPIIEGLLQPGYTVAYGKWKRSRKTTLFLACAYAIQAGVPFLGHKTRKLRVLWVQRDMPVSLWVLYARKIRVGMGLPPTAIPFIADPVDFSKAEDRKAFLAFLDALPEEERPQLIFFDSSRAVSRTKENDADEVAAFTRGFLCDELRDRRKMAVILVAHPGKNSEGVRGSGDWEAGTDSTLTFTPYPAERTKPWQYTEVTGEGRYSPISFSFTIDDDSDITGSCTFSEIDPETKSRLQGKDPSDTLKNRILNFMDTHPGKQLHSDIITLLGGRHIDTKNELISMKALGWLILVPGPTRGNYYEIGPNRPVVPVVPDDPDDGRNLIVPSSRTTKSPDDGRGKTEGDTSDNDDSIRQPGEEP